MNDTRALRSGTSTDVRAYVARVRAALSDLPAEDVEELTQGMEADLTELAAESDSIRARLGTPETYAGELRAAAGFSPRTPSGQGGGIGAALEKWSARWTSIAALPWVRDLLPIGWVLRGVVIAWVVAHALGMDSSNLLGWALGAAVSVWIGRATRTWTGGRRVAMTAINVAAALVGLILMLPAEMDRAPSAMQYIEGPAVPAGLANDGEPVTGITVYDATGRKVEQPRAFDQNGRPLLPAPAPEEYTPPSTLDPLPRLTPTMPPDPSSKQSSTPAPPTPSSAATPAPSTTSRQ